MNRRADGLIHSEQAASFGAALQRQNYGTSSHVVTKARVADTRLPWDKGTAYAHYATGKTFSILYSNLFPERVKTGFSSLAFSFCEMWRATKEGARKASGKLSSSKLKCWPDMFKSPAALKKRMPVFTHTEGCGVGSIFQIHKM